MSTVMVTFVSRSPRFKVLVKQKIELGTFIVAPAFTITRWPGFLFFFGGEFILGWKWCSPVAGQPAIYCIFYQRFIAKSISNIIQSLPRVLKSFKSSKLNPRPLRMKKGDIPRMVCHFLQGSYGPCGFRLFALTVCGIFNRILQALACSHRLPRKSCWPLLIWQ